MTPKPEQSSGRDYDRVFERLANAEGYLRTARIDLQRLDIADCAGAIEGCIAKIREVSDALVRSEAARAIP